MSVEAVQMTDPGLAAEFVAAAGGDALAVAVGNVYGTTGTPAVIHLVRLEELHQAVEVPLVLYGASGSGPDVLHACPSRGVAKVNVNIELR